jgi:hypothetical protein
MQKRALEQERDRRQRDVRVGADVEALPWREIHATQVVVKNEWPDQLTQGAGEGAAHEKATHVALTGFDH